MLILAEKPNVAKEFASTLNCSFAHGFYQSHDGSILITNCVGHLFQLAEPLAYGEQYKDWTALPIIPEKYIYYSPAAVKQQADLVVSLLRRQRSDSILIATDADREGEVIARECLAMAGINDFSKIRRFWVSQALTPDVIREGIRNAKPLSVYDKLAQQGESRQRADWLVGMNFSRFMSVAANKKLPVGRVQTAILSAIHERCEAIKNFKSEKYFEYWGTFRPSRDGSTVSGIYFEHENTTFKNNELTSLLKSKIGCAAKIENTTAEQKEQNAPALYNLNDAQQDAFKFFGYSAKETLSIIQSLYEEKKCVSYPRTPSHVMGSQNVELCRQVFASLADRYSQFQKLVQSVNITAANKRCFNDAKLEAHHALIPLKPLPAAASEKEQNVYNLILERFMVAFLPVSKYEKITHVLTIGDGLRFKVSGRESIDEGWKRFTEYQEKGIFHFYAPDRHVTDGDDPDAGNQIIKNIDWNSLSFISLDAKEKWTRAPKYFNEASILAFMENPKTDRHVTVGNPPQKIVRLATEATQHTFVPKLMSHGYIDAVKKNLICTDLGTVFLRAVQSSPIKSIADITATTDWEERLNNDPAAFYKDIEKFVRSSVQTLPNIEIPRETNGGIMCPLCGKEIRKGKTNWFCTGYKTGCTFVLWETVAGAKLTAKDVGALCAGKRTGIHHCTNKAGKIFDCKFAYNKETNKIDFVFEDKIQKTDGRKK